MSPIPRPEAAGARWRGAGRAAPRAGPRWEERGGKKGREEKEIGRRRREEKEKEGPRRGGDARPGRGARSARPG